MAETESLLIELAVVYLLENLYRVCDQLPQIRADPNTGNRIPGVQVNSSEMELRLPGEKIRSEAGKVLQPNLVSALSISRLVCSDICQQAGGNSFPTAEQPSQGAIAVVHGEETSPQSPPPSRCLEDRSDWKLCPAIFRQITQRLGPLEVDLFASRLTFQLDQYVSWRPDPMAMTTDAFTLDWAELRGFANPPWILIGRVLAQTHLQQAELVLVAPVWKAQVW